MLYDWAKSVDLPKPNEDARVYVYHENESLGHAYAQETGWDVQDAIDLWSSGRMGGTAAPDSIYIKARPPDVDVDQSYLDWLSFAAAHEMVHTIYQIGLLGLTTNHSYFNRNPQYAPYWFGEGMAELYTALAEDYSSQRPYYLERADRVWRVATFAQDISLSDVEELPDASSDEGHWICLYSCGMLAVELLASEVGLRELTDYHTLMRPGATWRQSFENAFDMTVDEFYILFEEHRANGFPEPDTGDFPTGSQDSEITEQRVSLVTLYNTTDGRHWSTSTNWLSHKPIGVWHGVTTDKVGRVAKLHLWNNRLSGPIPPELKALINLTSLAIQDNQLSGPIPTELGNLTNLEHLALWGNELRGQIPTELGRLKGLKELWLDNNQLSGQIPAELGNLSNMTDLRLHNNQLREQIPIELGNLPNLTHLYLAGNMLTGCVPSALGYVPNNDFAALGLPFC